MQLTRLVMINFRQHRRTELDFGAELLAIVGPNGSGKSTILEAIAWALYGNPAARGTRDTIPRRGMKPGEKASVELEFRLGSRNFRLVRTRTNAELFQDSEAVANSATAVTQRVESLLGMSRVEFFNTYFTGQKDLAAMSAMGGAVERGRFLSRVLGYDRLRDAQELLRSRRNGARAELNGLMTGMPDAEELKGELAEATARFEAATARHESAMEGYAAAHARVEQLAPAWRAAEEKRAAFVGLEGELRQAESRVENARQNFTRLDAELLRANEARQRLDELAPMLSQLPELLAERERLDQVASAVTARSEVLARRNQIALRRADIESKLAALPTADAVSAAREAEAAALGAAAEAESRYAERQTRWTADRQEAEGKLNFHLDQFRELERALDQLVAAGADGICPTCQRPLGDNAAATINLLRTQLEEVRANGQYFRKRSEQLKSQPPEVHELDLQRQQATTAARAATAALATVTSSFGQRSELDAELVQLAGEQGGLDAQLSDPVASYDSERHEEVRGRIRELEPIRSEHDRLAGLAARAVELAQEAASAEQAASAAETAVAQLHERIKLLEWDADEFESLRVGQADAASAVQVADRELAAAVEMLEGARQLRDTATRRQEDRAAKAQTADRLRADIMRWDELDRSFSELRTQLNQQLRPELRDRTAGFLGHLTNGRYSDVELDEDYKVTVVEDGEAKPVISGGEEDVVSLALRLSISEMIADRAGQPLSLLVLDEVFGSLDEERRQSVVDLLRSLADRFPQVIMISHIEGLRDAFDRVLRVSYDAESRSSTVVEDQPELTDAAA